MEETFKKIYPKKYEESKINNDLQVNIQNVDVNIEKNSNNNEFESALAKAKIFNEVESNHELIRLAIINDKDGYTNVRSESNSKSDILFKLTNEDEFHVINPSKDNSWWIICFENKYGFMHQSKIEIIDGFL